MIVLEFWLVSWHPGIPGSTRDIRISQWHQDSPRTLEFFCATGLQGYQDLLRTLGSSRYTKILQGHWSQPGKPLFTSYTRNYQRYWGSWEHFDPLGWLRFTRDQRHEGPPWILGNWDPLETFVFNIDTWIPQECQNPPGNTWIHQGCCSPPGTLGSSMDTWIY